MSANEKYVTMIGIHLRKLGDIEFSGGIVIHWYEKGVEAAWVRINEASDKYTAFSYL